MQRKEAEGSVTNLHTAKKSKLLAFAAFVMDTVTLTTNSADFQCTILHALHIVCDIT